MNGILLQACCAPSLCTEEERWPLKLTVLQRLHSWVTRSGKAHRGYKGTSFVVIHSSDDLFRGRGRRYSRGCYFQNWGNGGLLYGNGWLTSEWIVNQQWGWSWSQSLPPEVPGLGESFKKQKDLVISLQVLICVEPKAPSQEPQVFELAK